MLNLQFTGIPDYIFQFIPDYNIQYTIYTRLQFTIYSGWFISIKSFIAQVTIKLGANVRTSPKLLLDVVEFKYMNT